MKSNSWLSANIYYDKSANIFLRGTILNLVKSIEKKFFPTKYFFIRYQDSIGKHIRLRIKTKTGYDKQLIKDYILDKTRLTDGNSRKRYEFAQIRFNEYVPEFYRYGGNVGLEISEAQFHVSSNTILSLISRDLLEQYENTLGISLQLHTGFISKMNLNAYDAVLFFKNYTKVWHPEIITGIDKDTNNNFIEELKNQAEKLYPMIKVLWDNIDREFEEAWFNKWIKQHEKIHSRILEEETEIKKYLREYGDNNIYSNNIWKLYASYIHMTNNRLGILNHDEGSVSYILHEIFKRIN